MTTLSRKVERRLQGTPFESFARSAWSWMKGWSRPRARLSAKYDRQTIQIMSRVLRADSNCVDVGAHSGWLLRQMVDMAPMGRHFAFEPIPELARDLERRFPRVRVHEVALSDGPGEPWFHHVLDSPARSGFRPMGHVPVDARIRRIRVRVDRLDDLLPDDLPIDFIKVDVEGAQLQVFQGAARTISTFGPVVVFEHGMLARDSYGTTSEMIYDCLVERFGLGISLLSDWLEGKPALTRRSFCGHVGYHPGSHFCFIAHR